MAEFTPDAPLGAPVRPIGRPFVGTPAEGKAVTPRPPLSRRRGTAMLAQHLAPSGGRPAATGSHFPGIRSALDLGTLRAGPATSLPRESSAAEGAGEVPAASVSSVAPGELLELLEPPRGTDAPSSPAGFDDRATSEGVTETQRIEAESSDSPGAEAFEVRSSARTHASGLPDDAVTPSVSSVIDPARDLPEGDVTAATPTERAALHASDLFCASREAALDGTSGDSLPAPFDVLPFPAPSAALPEGVTPIGELSGEEDEAGTRSTDDGWMVGAEGAARWSTDGVTCWSADDESSSGAYPGTSSSADLETPASAEGGSGVGADERSGCARDGVEVESATNDWAQAAWGPDDSTGGEATPTISPLPVADASGSEGGQVRRNHAADLLEGMADRVRRGEIDVAAEVGAPPQLILARLLASILSTDP